MSASLRERFWGPPLRVDELGVTALALAVRLASVLWAWDRFPPADDGHFYDVVADRIAHGRGYTWLWPDGAVTYAAHYPVGYPALIGAFYRLFGSHAGVAMLLNAALGTWGVWAIYRLCATFSQRWPALVGGLIAALHPSLVFYTPALMTEGVSASLIAVLGWLSVRARSERQLVPIGLLGGVTVLVRPQLLLLMPFFGMVAGRWSPAARVRAACVVSALAVLVCLPWTIRNCARLDHCAFVSANGGWNLFIGSADKATGTWVSIDELGVPPECRTVFGEADKDRCFGRAGVRNVLERPAHFLSLVPKKLSATFDWSGAPGHYLNASNGAAFSSSSALTLGVAEAIVQRSLVLLALLGLGRAPGVHGRARKILAAVSTPWLFTPYAWVAYLALVALVALLWRAALDQPTRVLGAAVVAATAVTHAIFFGAGRYGLVCVLVLVPLAVEPLVRHSPLSAK